MGKRERQREINRRYDKSKYSMLLDVQDFNLIK